MKRGADYLAPYYNRMENLNIDSDAVISQLAQAIERGSFRQQKYWQLPLRMLVKSIVLLLIGAQAITQDLMSLQQLCHAIYR